MAPHYAREIQGEGVMKPISPLWGRSGRTRGRDRAPASRRSLNAFGPHLLLAALEGLVTSAVLALTALGLSLVFGVMRVVNVAHGEFFMLGAVVAWFVSTLIAGHPALGFLAALIVSPLVVGAVALAAERLVLRRLNYDPEATIVATIGMLYIIQQLALSFYGPEARPVEAPFSYRILFPWFGYSGYKLAVVAASIAAARSPPGSC